MSGMTPSIDSLRVVARELAAAYATQPGVEAVALAGSLGTGVADPASDLDLYVYTREPVAPAWRQQLVSARASRAEVNNQFFEPGDEWIERESGLAVDVMFRSPEWIEEQLDRVLVRHQASVGYTTCFWHSVLAAEPLFDRGGWFAALQRRASQPYPEPLRRAIVAKNHPLLRRNISSYVHQLEKAERRGDRVSLNHRVAALLASYFDILFALNRLPHPGEKRLVALAEQRCRLRPAGLREQVERLLQATATPGGQVAPCALALVDGLDALLAAEALLTPG